MLNASPVERLGTRAGQLPKGVAACEDTRVSVAVRASGPQVQRGVQAAWAQARVSPPARC